MACDRKQDPDAQTCFAERRKNRRLKVHLDIVLHLERLSGEPVVVEKACTQDVSPGDMYFESHLGDRLRVGEIVGVDIELPMQSSTIFSERRLTVRARVARVAEPGSEGPGRRGIAVVFLEPPVFRRSLD